MPCWDLPVDSGPGCVAGKGCHLINNFGGDDVAGNWFGADAGGGYAQCDFFNQEKAASLSKPLISSEGTPSLCRDYKWFDYDPIPGTDVDGAWRPGRCCACGGGTMTGVVPL